MTSATSPSSAIDATHARVLQDRVILCLRLSDPAIVLDACRAAIRGGLEILELTLTTPGALEVMAQLAKEDAAVVGAGTVLSVQDVERVAQAGGRFAMSPVFDAEVVAAAHQNGMLAVPGAATPTEILAAHRSGARLVKVFPAAALGGPPFLKAVRGPLPDIPLVPTSGPTADTLADYFAVGASAVGIGGEVFPPGFTLEHVEQAARRVRLAVEAVPV
jgi:2-dehydro-3-deoxyphosphogluconate aldolase/(4S)-4-hydroxy-2-oxoglutarate aldolase